MKTPFHDLHISLGARIVDFHGWEMPLQYSGIVDEHTNVRRNAGLFDVSHMGRIAVKGAGAVDSIQRLVTNDIAELGNRSARYSPMCYENGTIVDDLIVYRLSHDDFLIVCNASNRQKDLEWIIAHSKDVAVQDISDETCLLALQGPKAAAAVQKLVELKIQGIKPFSFFKDSIGGIICLISRTGYTGEDGFEILFDSSKIEVWNCIMQLSSEFRIKPAGLGARDTLRIESGLMLYGNDIDDTITPLEVPLKWTVHFEKEFVGREALIKSRPTRKLVGFEVPEKRIARHGNRIFVNGADSGYVTSGSFSPTLKKSIGFCFVPLSVGLGEAVEIDIGGKHYPAKITTTKFYKRT